MKSSFAYLLLFFCLSCASLQKTEGDPFIGKYKMTVFNVDGVGDVPAILTITKRKKCIFLKQTTKFSMKKDL